MSKEQFIQRIDKELYAKVKNDKAREFFRELLLKAFNIGAGYETISN